MAVAGAASLLFSSAGSAAPAPRQSEALGCLPLGCPRPFRLIRLCEVLPPVRGGRPEGLFNLYTSDNTFGISDDGFVTGTRRVLFPTSPGCDPDGFHSGVPGPGGSTVVERGHSFLWLPRAAFGLPQSAAEPAGCADTVYDLHGHAGLPANEFSFGNDISAIADDGTGNEIAYVVGISFCNPDLTRAVVWRLHTYTTTPTPSVSIFDITKSNHLAYAYAVSAPAQLDGSTATKEVVVAGRHAELGCPANHVGIATWVDVTGPVGLPIELDPVATPARTSAVDVAMLSVVAPPPFHRAVGYDTPQPSNPCSTSQPIGSQCDGFGIDAHRWSFNPATGAYATFQPDNYPPLPTHPLATPDGEERGVNRHGWTAGWGRTPIPFPLCSGHAVVRYDTQNSVGVQDITPSASDQRVSRAEALTDVDVAGGCTVVGWSSNADRALVWRGLPGGAWCEYDATSITLNDVDCVAVNESVCLPNAKGTPNGIVVEIVELHDVNKYGHAVGVIRETIFDEGGTDPVSITYYAAVLGPAADLNEDLRVGPEDLAIFLGEWGNPSPSIGDLDADGDVDQADLSLLIGSWQFVGGLSRVAVPDPTGNGCACGLLGGGSPEGGPESASASATSDPDAILEAIAILGFGTMGEFAGWVASATDAQIDGAIAFIQNYAASGSGQGADQESGQ